MSFSEGKLLSVIVCTWNPGDRINDTLTSLKYQSLSSSQYEVIVVDNGSNDGSNVRLFQECEKLSYIYIEEPNQGLSNARNTAINAACTEIVYFIDDDAIAPPHLLQLLLDEFERNRNVIVVGGPVHGLWEETPPNWLAPKYWGMLSLMSYGPTSRVLTGAEIAIGCNMGFRREVFRKFGYFDNSLGRKGTNLIGNEERSMQLKLREHGRDIFYSANLYVFHKVPKERMTFDYLTQRSRGAAISNAMIREPESRIKFCAHLLKGYLLAFIIIPYHGVKACLSTINVETRFFLSGSSGHWQYFKSLFK